ncbi:MAG: eukaryotic-like serine/threonine-protein kinase [Thermoanaerobaculia bacterium]|jgi:TonB family protein|nr:eukaryotic-like serine/threonine-protein kinase [Thermoanaerobaculia bacterium]
MAAKNRPYEQFGTFILFKKLDTDALGDLWRAAHVEGSALGPMLALRRMSGGNRAAMTQAASEANQLVPLLSGTTFAKEQMIDVTNGIPFVAHEYAGGRSLRHIVDRARGDGGTTPNPVPLDQAIVIAEKIALSLATTADLRYLGNRLSHGALIPQFVWITDEGEIRVAGQQLGKGIIASLADSKVASELGRYFPAEYRSSGEISKTTDVYSLGAIIYLLVTGNEPPDAVTASAFTQTIRAARTFSGQPLPDDLRTIMEKSLAIDPNARYASIGDMKQVLSALVHGGNYSASTFNLAFYLSNLLKKELEGETLEIEKEQKVNVAAYALAPAAAAPGVAPIASAEEPSKSRMPLLAIAAAALIAVSLGAYFMLKPKPPAATVVHAAAAPPRPKIISQPVIAAVPTSTATTATVDPSAQKKAFEAAVEQKMQEEMMKLQADMNKQLKQQQSRNAPVQTASMISPTPPTQVDDRGGAAAALDQRRVNARQEVPATQTLAQAPALTPSQPAAVAPIVQPQTAAVTIHEGDVIDVTELDKVPEPLSVIHPFYPPLAAQQRASATIIITALISETGDVTEVKVLRGDPRFGFNEAAIRAMRAVRFTPAIKDGKRVKTWRPQSITFKM